MPVGVNEVESLLLGLYCHGHQHGVTGATRERKWFVRLLIGTFRREYPGFPFTSIQINHGFACRPHVDRNNSGPSALVALGEFTGGELWVHEPVAGAHGLTISPEEGQVSAVYRTGTPFFGTAFDVKESWVLFDGRKLHCTLPFEGDRYSLVFFTGPDTDKAPLAVRH